MATPITFDGYEGQFLACPTINVWQDYADRTKGIVAQVEHGQSGVLLKREGNRCQVQVGDVTGFVTFYFIREEKARWQAQQLALQKSKVGVRVD